MKEWKTSPPFDEDHHEPVALEEGMIPFEAMVRSAGVPIVGCNPDGRILTWNAAAAKSYGYDEDLILGRPLSTLTHPSAATAVEELLARARNGETVAPLHSVQMTRDGELLNSIISLSPLCKGESEITGIVMVAHPAHPIIEERSASRALEAGERSRVLEDAGLIAGGVAADLNQFLDAILSHCATAGEGTRESDPVRAHLERIDSEGRRSRELVEQILELVRYTGGRMTATLLEPIVQEVVRSLRASFTPEIRIQTKIDPDCPPARIRAEEFHRILVNLCINAGQSMEKRGGVLDVSLILIKTDIGFFAVHTDLREKHYLRLTIGDSGAGMKPEVIRHAFEPFFTTRPSTDGAGLGLAIVHGIVSACRGSISIQSEVGVGSTVHVFLPLADAG